jgi:hypothetical protein
MKRPSFPLFIALAALSLFFLSLYTYSFSADKPPAAQQQISQKSGLPSQAGKNQEIQNIKPRKPVKIRLHRNTNGHYSWDISGDNADEVYRADSRLRKLLKIDE